MYEIQRAWYVVHVYKVLQQYLVNVYHVPGTLHLVHIYLVPVIVRLEFGILYLGSWILTCCLGFEMIIMEPGIYLLLGYSSLFNKTVACGGL